MRWLSRHLLGSINVVRMSSNDESWPLHSSRLGRYSFAARNCLHDPRNLRPLLPIDQD